MGFLNGWSKEGVSLKYRPKSISNKEVLNSNSDWKQPFAGADDQTKNSKEVRETEAEGEGEATKQEVDLDPKL